jgi:DNA-binding MarR family transcriptional regulator
MTRNGARPTATNAQADKAKAGVGFDGLDALVGYQLRRTQGVVHRDYLSAVEGLNLTQKQTGVLWLVECNPGVAQGALGAALDMDRATTMAVVDRLEERGLLVRRKSAVDARRRELHVTPAGAKLLARAKSRIAAHEIRLKASLSSRELKTLLILLQRLQQGAGR